MLCNKCFCCIIFSLLYCTCLQFLLYGCFVLYNLLYTMLFNRVYNAWYGPFTVVHVCPGGRRHDGGPLAGTRRHRRSPLATRSPWRRNQRCRVTLRISQPKMLAKTNVNPGITDLYRTALRLQVGAGKKRKGFFFFEVQSLFESRWFWSRINSMAP